jgi:hypothetical protein
MEDTIWRVKYYYTFVQNKVGAGAAVLEALKAQGVDLFALNAFPVSAGRAQVDLMAPDIDALLAAAKKAGIELIGPREAFLVQGDNRVGALADALSKLAHAGISITAAQAVASGDGRFGAIIWVRPRNVQKAALALGIS